MKPVDLGTRRKVDLCDYCGEPEHAMPFACPRITKIRYGPDGEIDVYFTTQKDATIIKFNADDADL